MECAGRAGRGSQQGKGGQLVPSRLEPDHESSCPNRWILPPHFQVPVPSWEHASCAPDLPGPKEKEGRKGMRFLHTNRTSILGDIIGILFGPVISTAVPKYLFDR